MNVKVYGTSWCGDCRKATTLLDNRGVAYQYIDLEESEDAAHEVEVLTNGYHSVPTIVFPNGTVLVEPSREELESAIEHQSI